MTLKNISGARQYFSFGSRGYNLDPDEEITFPYSTPGLAAHVAKYVDDGTMEVTVPPTAEEVDPHGLNPALGIGGSGPLNLIRCVLNRDAHTGHNAFTIEFLPDSGDVWLMYDVTGDDPVLLDTILTSGPDIHGPITWSTSIVEIAFSKTEADMAIWWNPVPPNGPAGPIIDFQHQNGSPTIGDGSVDYYPWDRVYIQLPDIAPAIHGPQFTLIDVSSDNPIRSNLILSYVIVGADANFNSPGIVLTLR